MRKIFSLLLIISIKCFSQETPFPINADGKVEFTEVINVDSASASDLYSRSKVFITNAFVSGKDVTQLADDNSKTMIGKGNMKVYLSKALTPFDGRVKFSITIQCKDGRYKYLISEFVANYQSGLKSPYIDESLELDKGRWITKNQWSQIKEQVYNTVQKIIDDMKKQMGKKPENW